MDHDISSHSRNLPCSGQGYIAKPTHIRAFKLPQAAIPEYVCQRGVISVLPHFHRLIFYYDKAKG